MALYKRSQIWWYEFVFHGQRIRESTGSGSKMLAVKAERQRRRELEESANGVRAARRPVLFPTASREWMAANRARWSESNVAIQEFNLKHLSAYFGSMLVADITPLGAFKEWRGNWPNAKPDDYVFPTEKLMFKGEGAPEKGIMTRYEVDPTKPLGAWKRAWSTAKKQAGVDCRIHDLRHHFISALAQTQTPDATIQAISGHLSRKMLNTTVTFGWLRSGGQLNHWMRCSLFNRRTCVVQNSCNCIGVPTNPPTISKETAKVTLQPTDLIGRDGQI